MIIYPLLVKLNNKTEMLWEMVFEEKHFSWDFESNLLLLLLHTQSNIDDIIHRRFLLFLTKASPDIYLDTIWQHRNNCAALK